MSQPPSLHPTTWRLSQYQTTQWLKLQAIDTLSIWLKGGASDLMSWVKWRGYEQECCSGEQHTYNARSSSSKPSSISNPGDLNIETNGERFAFFVYTLGKDPPWPCKEDVRVGSGAHIYQTWELQQGARWCGKASMGDINAWTSFTTQQG